MGKASSSIYNPSSLINIIKNSFFIDELKGTIVVKGIYKKNKEFSCYNGYYFDLLMDEINRKYSISIRVSSQIRDKLIDGKSYTFEGSLGKFIGDDGTIRPNITIDYEKFHELGYYYTNDHNKEFSIRKQKISQGHKNLSFLLESKLYNDKKPNIAIITGNSSKALGDIYSTMEEIKNNFNMKVYHINITSKYEILDVLSQINGEDFDIVLLTRGGGNMVDLDVFNDTEISESVLNLNPVFVTAIGHAGDTSLLQEISDRDFTTPTDFGTYLKDTFLQVNNRVAKENSLQQQIDLLEKEQKQMIEDYKKRSIALLALGIIFGLIINRFLG